MNINDFKNFSEFLVYIRQNEEGMQHWSDEKTKTFCDRVSELMEKSPEFKEQYDNWAKRLELKERARSIKIKIGGSEEDTLYTKAYLKLKAISKEKQNKKSQSTTPVCNSGKVIEI